MDVVVLIILKRKKKMNLGMTQKIVKIVDQVWKKVILNIHRISLGKTDVGIVTTVIDHYNKKESDYSDSFSFSILLINSSLCSSV